MKFTFSEYELDADALELRFQGELVRLPPLPIRLLCHLVRSPGRLVRKEELLRDVWDDAVVGDASLTTAIRQLRRALDRGSTPSLIETRHGLGYRIRAPIVETGGKSPSRRLDADATSPLAAIAVGSDDRPALSAAPLIGRVEEQRIVRRSLALLRKGRGGVLILEGEAGIGKTRLLEWCAHEARAYESHAIFVRCREDEGAPALLPCVDALRSLRRHHPGIVAAALDRDEQAFAHVLPEVCPSPLERNFDRATDPDRLRFRAYDGLVELLRTCSDASPLALLFDDIHLAHRSWTSLLEFIASRLADARVLIVCTLRPQTTPDESVIDLVRTRRCVTRSLERWGRAEVAEALRAHRGKPCSAELVESLWHQTGGNPFLLDQVVPILEAASAPGREGTLADALPHSVRKAIEQACVDLSEPARRALRMASVFGESFSARSLASLLECPVEEVLELLDESALLGLVEPIAETSHAYRYVHLLVRDVLYRELGGKGRSRAHWAAGRLLELSLEPTAESAAEIAGHFAEAGSRAGIEKATTLYTRAARDHAARYEHDAAIACYRRGLDLLDRDEPRRCDLLTELALETRMIGDLDGARALWCEATACARGVGHECAMATLALEVSAAFDGDSDLLDVEEAARLLLDAIATPARDDSGTRLELSTTRALKHTSAAPRADGSRVADADREGCRSLTRSQPEHARAKQR